MARYRSSTQSYWKYAFILWLVHIYGGNMVWEIVPIPHVLGISRIAQLNLNKCIHGIKTRTLGHWKFAQFPTLWAFGAKKPLGLQPYCFSALKAHLIGNCENSIWPGDLAIVSVSPRIMLEWDDKLGGTFHIYQRNVIHVHSKTTDHIVVHHIYDLCSRNVCDKTLSSCSNSWWCTFIGSSMYLSC